MSVFFEYDFRLNGLDVDGRGQCKASALLNHLQNSATLASEEAGLSHETLLERYGVFWMLARSWYRLSQPLRYEDRLTVRTWHRGSKGAVMYRDYDILANGLPVGESVSAWVLASADTRKLVRLNTIPELEGTGGGALCKTMTLTKLRQPGDLREVERRLMRYSDTDLNGHVNNTRYADFACDAVGMDALPEDRYLAEMQIGYLAECRPGEALSIQVGGQGDSRFVRGVDSVGESRFDSVLIFGETSA